jgi:hypothetical protein
MPDKLRFCRVAVFKAIKEGDVIALFIAMRIFPIFFDMVTSKFH